MTPRPHGSESPKPGVADLEQRIVDAIHGYCFARLGTVHNPSLAIFERAFDAQGLRVVEAPVSPPELTELDALNEALKGYAARVEELEAALAELLAMWDGDDWDAKVERETWERARRALRGSVPAGEDDDG